MLTFAHVCLHFTSFREPEICICEGLFAFVLGCNRQIVGQPRTRECRQNIRKMSKKCPKNVQKLSGGAENTIFGHFLTIFAYLVDASVWYPVQCAPITSFGFVKTPFCYTPLGLSPSTVGSPDWFREWFRKEAHRFSQSDFQPYSETP